MIICLTVLACFLFYMIMIAVTSALYEAFGEKHYRNGEIDRDGQMFAAILWPFGFPLIAGRALCQFFEGIYKERD